MKKITFILQAFILTQIIACNPPPSMVEQTTFQKNPIANFVEKFSKQNPNWGQNEIINDSINQKFRIELENFYKSKNVFSKTRFKVISITPLPKKKYAIHLENSYTKLTDDAEINFEIIALADQKIINIINQNNEIEIQGKFIKFIGNDLKNYFDTGIFNTRIYYDTDPMFQGYYLGVALINLQSISKNN